MNTRSRSNHVLMFSCLLSVALTGIGCTDAADGLADDVPLGFDQQAFGGYITGTWGTSGSNLDLDLRVPGSSWTCFLAGVAGNLTPQNIFVSPGLNDFIPGEATVRLIDGDWHLEIGTGRGHAVLASAMCLPTADRTNEVFWTGGAAVPLGTGTQFGSLQCGLTRIFTDRSFNDFTSSSDSVQVFNESNTVWKIGGTGNANGAAQCVHTSPGGGVFQLGTLVAGSSQINRPLVQHVPDVGANPLGTQCFLTMVGGSFQNNDFNDGISIAFNSSVDTWNLSLSPRKTVGVTCLQ